MRKISKTKYDLSKRDVCECYGCGRHFTVDHDDFRANPNTDPELIYCDTCNEEARQWCERVEAQIYP